MILCGTAEGLCQVDETLGYGEPEPLPADNEQHWPSCPADCVYPHKLIGDIARGQTTKWNRNGSWVEYEDVLQEAWVAYLTHKTLIDEYLATSRRTEARYLIRDHVYRFCRKEKARRSGYDPEDEHLYTLKALRALLPGAFGGDVASEGGSSLEPRKGRGGGGTGSDLDTSLIDVRWGLERVDGYDREMLFWASTGGGWEQPPARAALRRLQTVLGGAPG